MALEFYEASCVLAGTFNIYIIRPDWLGKIGLLPENTEVKFEFQTSQPGFRISSPRLTSRWNVKPDRLTLGTSDENVNCGETVATVMERLPWTPLTAIGCNVVYRASIEDIEKWRERTAFPLRESPENGQLTQRTWHAAVTKESQVFNLQLSDSEGKIEVRANVHTNLENRDIECGREVAKRFFSLREDSLSLIREIFNVGLIDDIINQ